MADWLKCPLMPEACRKPESTVKAAVTVSAEPLSDRVTTEAPEPSPSGPGTTPRVAESAEACPVPSSASTAATETDIDHSPRVLRPLKLSASQEPNSRNATTTPRRLALVTSVSLLKSLHRGQIPDCTHAPHLKARGSEDQATQRRHTLTPSDVGSNPFGSEPELGWMQEQFGKFFIPSPERDPSVHEHGKKLLEISFQAGAANVWTLLE